MRQSSKIDSCLLVKIAGKIELESLDYDGSLNGMICRNEKNRSARIQDRKERKVQSNPMKGQQSQEGRDKSDDSA